jgi:hypothetical protein
MSATEQTYLPLPGLEPAVKAAGDLAAAVRRSIAALNDEGLVAERDAARLALALEMADIIEIKKSSGRMSTVGNDARVLVDLLDKLLPEATETDQRLADAMEEWARLIEAEDAREAAAREAASPP